MLTGDSQEAPERVEDDEVWATPVLLCRQGSPIQVVPFDTLVRMQGRRPWVVIQGPWKTGTNVLKAYVERFFDVDVPTVGTKNGWQTANYQFATDGRMWWKHEPLRSAVLLPELHVGRPVVILATVREPTRWINALAHGAYELRAGRGNLHSGNKGKGDHRWLQEGPVEFQHPITHEVFRYKCADQLWAEYAYGVMKGRLATESEKLRTRVVRHEDLVLQPLAVLQGLAKLGLPRKLQPGSRRPLPFHEIDDIKGMYWSNKDRQTNDLKNEVLQGGVWAEYCLEKVAARLDQLGPLLDVFGYARRVGYATEPVNKFGADVEVYGPEEPAQPQQDEGLQRPGAVSAPAPPLRDDAPPLLR